MALFDFTGPVDQGWLSSAFQSLPQYQIDPNAGWPGMLAGNMAGRDAWARQQAPMAPQAPQGPSPFDAPGQYMGFNQTQEPAPLPQMPIERVSLPASGMPDAALVPPATPQVPEQVARQANAPLSPLGTIAQRYGLDPQAFQRYAQIESGGNPKSVTGSYKGLFQLSDSEFRKYGGGNIFDPVDNANAAARKLQAESNEFRAQYGRDPTATDLYMIHQQGPAGYAAHLANPERPAWQNMLSTGEGRQKGERWAKAAIWGNVPDQLKRQFGSVDNITSAQFVDLWRNKVEGQSGTGIAAGGPQSYPGGNLPAPGARPPVPAAQMPAIGGQRPAGEPSIGDRIQAAGAGFFNAGSPMQAIGNLIGGAITGQRQDPYGISAQLYGQQLQLAQQSQQAAVDYVAQSPNIAPPLKAALVQQPALALKYVSEIAKPPEYKFEKVDQHYGRFDPKSGRFDIQGVAPKLEKLGPGDNLYSVVPGAAPSQVASGGPDKPPAGYTWKDPNKPAAGLVPIPGGPESKLPANEAGILAMMQASRPGVEAAKQYYLSPDFKSGPIDAAGKAISQATNSFELSRHRRSIELATEAALRMATGAAAPDTEVKRYANFYMPSVYDDEATRRQKLEALTRFMDYAQKNIGLGRVPEPGSFMGGGNGGWSVKRLPN